MRPDTSLMLSGMINRLLLLLLLLLEFGVFCELVCDRVLELLGGAEESAVELLLLFGPLLLLFFDFFVDFESLIPRVCGKGKVDELKLVLDVTPETLEAPVCEFALEGIKWCIIAFPLHGELLLFS